MTVLDAVLSEGSEITIIQLALYALKLLLLKLYNLKLETRSNDISWHWILYNTGLLLQNLNSLNDVVVFCRPRIKSDLLAHALNSNLNFDL